MLWRPCRWLLSLFWFYRFKCESLYNRNGFKNLTFRKKSTCATFISSKLVGIFLEKKDWDPKNWKNDSYKPTKNLWIPGNWFRTHPRNASFPFGRLPNIWTALNGPSVKLIWAEQLPAVRVGRRVHLDLFDLDKWIEQNKIEEILWLDMVFHKCYTHLQGG